MDCGAFLFATGNATHNVKSIAYTMPISTELRYVAVVDYVVRHDIMKNMKWLFQVARLPLLCTHTIIFADFFPGFFCSLNCKEISSQVLDVHSLDRKHVGAPSHFSGSQAVHEKLN